MNDKEIVQLQELYQEIGERLNAIQGRRNRKRVSFSAFLFLAVVVVVVVAFTLLYIDILKKIDNLPLITQAKYVSIKDAIDTKSSTFVDMSGMQISIESEHDSTLIIDFNVSLHNMTHNSAAVVGVSYRGQIITSFEGAYTHDKNNILDNISGSILLPVKGGEEHIIKLVWKSTDGTHINTQKGPAGSYNCSMRVLELKGL